MGSGLINLSDQDDATANEEAASAMLRSQMLDILKMKDDFPLFCKASANWVKQDSDEKYHYLDEYLFLMKHLPKIFSRTNKFTGSLNLTSPPGGAKGTFIFIIKNFGGGRHDELVKGLDRNYFHESDAKARGSEECKPCVAACKNKAAVYCEELPDEELNVSRYKPFVEHRGGAISARFGGGRQKDDATHEPTYTLLTTGNSEIRVPSDAVGWQGKIHELQPAYTFANKGSALLPSQAMWGLCVYLFIYFYSKYQHNTTGQQQHLDRWRLIQDLPMTWPLGSSMVRFRFSSRLFTL